MFCSRRNVNMACDVDFISMSRNGHAQFLFESYETIPLGPSNETLICCYSATWALRGMGGPKGYGFWAAYV